MRTFCQTKPLSRCLGLFDLALCCNNEPSQVKQKPLITLWGSAGDTRFDSRQLIIKIKKKKQSFDGDEETGVGNSFKSCKHQNSKLSNHVTLTNLCVIISEKKTASFSPQTHSFTRSTLLSDTNTN